jgi:hypothetical protein
VTRTSLRKLLLGGAPGAPDGPAADALHAAFAAALRRRHRRAVATFQWLALAFYTVLAADVWRHGFHAGVAVGWALLAALAVVGPRLAAGRIAKRPLRSQVRFAGQLEGASVWMGAAMVVVLVVASVWRGAASHVPWSWLLATCAITVPALALVFRWVARAWARRSDPEWWE